MIQFNCSDLEYAISNYSIDMTILALFTAMKQRFPNDVEKARNITADIFNCYQNLPTTFFPAIQIDGTIYLNERENLK